MSDEDKNCKDFVNKVGFRIKLYLIYKYQDKLGWIDVNSFK
jgi:hypothetical protein